MALTVLVVDDVEVARAGLTSALEACSFEVVGAASSLAEAEEMAAQHGPDVAVVDMRLPDSSGFEIAHQICRVSPRTRILFVTAFESDIRQENLAAVSSHGVLLKSASLRELRRAVAQVAAGRPVLDPAIANSLVRNLGPSRSQDPITSLTPREREIFDLLARGYGDLEIAETLTISPRTAKNYVARILNKLGLSRRTQVPAYAAGTLIE